MRYLILSLLYFTLVFATQKYPVNIKLSHISEIQSLVELNIDLDHHRTKSEVHAFVDDTEFNAIQSLGYKITKIPNHAFEYYQELLDETRHSSNPLRGYHNYIELTEFMQNIANQYPDITNLFSIGQSVQGRELWVMEISDNPGVNEIEPEFKYIANMHGDETVGRELSLNIIEWLCTQYGVEDRATHIVNNVDVFIMPTMNPDGFELGQRYNANDVDLNRDFPDQFDDSENSPIGRHPETRAVMDWSNNHNFILSANMHTGALVANYPYDGPVSYAYSATPDDDLFIHLCNNYASNHSEMWDSPVFENGITNGAEWYAVFGGMQDWNYVWKQNCEITLEQYDVKWPDEELLPQIWLDNKESMINYIEQSFIGLRGAVLDATTNDPLDAILQIESIDHEVHTDPEHGDYYRLLTSGNYTATAFAVGYNPHTISFDLDDSYEFNFNLTPLDESQYSIEDFESNNFSLDWEFLGDGDWFIDDSESFDGGFSARSGTIGDNQESTLSIDVEIPDNGNMFFAKKISCENMGSSSGNYYDYLSFNIDGVEVNKWAGEQIWSVEWIPVSVGQHNFTWKFVKDGGVSSGDDAVWIDFIVFPQSETMYPIGDLNFDTIVNVIDIVLLVNVILGFNDWTGDYGWVDLNGDGNINVQDIVMLVEIVLED